MWCYWITYVLLSLKMISNNRWWRNLYVPLENLSTQSIIPAKANSVQLYHVYYDHWNISIVGRLKLIVNKYPFWQVLLILPRSSYILETKGVVVEDMCVPNSIHDQTLWSSLCDTPTIPTVLQPVSHLSLSEEQWLTASSLSCKNKIQSNIIKTHKTKNLIIASQNVQYLQLHTMEPMSFCSGGGPEWTYLLPRPMGTGDLWPSSHSPRLPHCCRPRPAASSPRVGWRIKSEGVHINLDKNSDHVQVYCGLFC